MGKRDFKVYGFVWGVIPDILNPSYRSAVLSLDEIEARQAEQYEGSVKDLLKHQMRENWERQPLDFSYREIGLPTLVGVVAFTVGHVDRCFGGREEGGWYYDHFTPERVFYVSREREQVLFRRLERIVDARNEGRRPLSSVLSDGRAAIRRGVEAETRRPHYS